LQEEATDICSLIIIEPLLSILNGGADRATQQTAAYCLKEAIKVFQMKQKTELLDYTAPRLYNLFLVNHEKSLTEYNFTDRKQTMISLNSLKLSQSLSSKLVSDLCKENTPHLQTNSVALSILQSSSINTT